MTTLRVLGLYCWNNTQGSLFFKNKTGSPKSMQLKLNTMNSTRLPRGLYYSNMENKLGVQRAPGPIQVGPFGKCSLWDDYTSGHLLRLETPHTWIPLFSWPSLNLPKTLWYRCVYYAGVQCTPGPIHVGPFGKCSLWDDYTSGHNAAARLAAGRLWAFIAEIITRGLYSSKIKQVPSNQCSWN